MRSGTVKELVVGLKSGHERERGCKDGVAECVIIGKI